MNILKLQSILQARGIRIKDNDPVFSILAMNEIVLQDLMEKTLSGDQTVSKLDAKKIQSILLANGLDVKQSDPIFSLVFLNDYVLDDALRKQNYLVIKHGKNRLDKPLSKPALFFGAFSFSLGISIAFFIKVMDVSAVVQGGTGLIVGALSGALMCFLLMVYARQNEPPSFAQRPEQTSEKPVGLAKTFWTEKEFSDAVLLRGTNLSRRVMAGCHAVLVDGVHAVDAANKNELLPVQITKAVNQLKGN